MTTSPNTPCLGAEESFDSQVNSPNLARENKSFYLIASINVNSWLQVKIKQLYFGCRVIEDLMLCSGKHNLNL